MIERSVQAQALIPMAVSLSFGVAFATLVTLLLVPAIYRLTAGTGSGRHPGSPAAAHPGAGGDQATPK